MGGDWDWKRAGTAVLSGGTSEAARAAGFDVNGGGSSGGGKGGKGAPAAPDFTAAAEAQARSAHANQRTPWASSQWTQGPDGQWSQSLTMDPALQAGSRNLMSQIASQGPAMTGDAARQQAIDSAMGQYQSRLDPQWAQRETEIRSRLANSGLDPGSEAYNSAMGDYGRERNDAYTSAMADAVRQGTSAGAVTFEQNRAAQMLPFQQLAALQGLSGLPGNPGGTNYLDAANAAYGGALNQYATQQAGKNSMMGGAAALAALSDERLKVNIERHSEEALPGVPFASWEWKDAPGERHYGVIAQDLEKVRPDLVHYRADGMRMVDYSFLLGK